MIARKQRKAKEDEMGPCGVGTANPQSPHTLMSVSEGEGGEGWGTGHILCLDLGARHMGMVSMRRISSCTLTIYAYVHYTSIKIIK